MVRAWIVYTPSEDGYHNAISYLRDNGYIEIKHEATFPGNKIYTFKRSKAAGLDHLNQNAVCATIAAVSSYTVVERRD